MSDLIDELRGWKEHESMSDDANRKAWLMHKAADEIERLRAEIEATEKLGWWHGELCHYCNKPVSNLSGDPGLWPLAFTHPEEPGKAKAHHTRCVMRRLQRTEKLEVIAKAAAAFEGQLSEDCDGEERDALRAALSANKAST